MYDFPPTVVLRHKKENLKKCSLTGLENRPDFKFYTYPSHELKELPGYIMLSFDGPLLSEKEAGKGLFILDATWRYAEKMAKSLPFFETIEKRSLPSHIRTAYPRRQDDCLVKERGLSSIEAIYVAYRLLHYPTEGLLDRYLWKERFIQQNEL